ncbi:hypothetical protein MTR67_004960 [Solanum verrucosum]|uniref:Uncharacterized protein n=1 Tax=Solanum verrucosum TaxID=315347 RepID=A0AAF0TFJ1_SOLVR|nr:hypothetical protein MTR67_004960 [Solanum verrucosum]
MSAKLIVEVTTEGSPSTVALAAAARQTGGKLVCIIPEPILDKTQKVIQETGLNDMVEFKTGDPVEILHNNVQGRKGIGGHLKKVENKVKVRSLQHPIGKGLEVTMIDRSKSGCYSHLIRGGENKNGHVVKKGDKSKWVFVVDEKSGEEHIYRMPKSSAP